MTHLTQRTYTSGVILCALFMLHYLPPLCFSLLLATILIYILRYEWPSLCPSSGYKAYLITLCYPVFPFALMMYMNECYQQLFMTMIILVATFDTGAYIFGSCWGRHPIAPRISPGKTWEGIIGGLLCTQALTLILCRYYTLPYSISYVIGFTFMLCAAGLAGDLFESWLKRRAGVKDSANILPGHGGFLDRFDSHMAAIIVLYILTYPSLQISTKFTRGERVNIERSLSKIVSFSSPG